MLEKKQKFIAQIMTSKAPSREMEDLDTQALNYGEIKALATGNENILKKTQLESEVTKLKLVKQSFLSQIYDLEDKIVRFYPNEIKKYKVEKSNLEEDNNLFKQSKLQQGEADISPINIRGIEYKDKEKAGKAILKEVANKKVADVEEIGMYRGFKVFLEYNVAQNRFIISLKNKKTYYTIISRNDTTGNLERLDTTLTEIKENIIKISEKIEESETEFEKAKIEVNREFPQEKILQEKMKELNEINIELKINEKDDKQALVLSEEEITEEKKEDRKNDSQEYDLDLII